MSNKTKLNITEIAKITGKSRTTIYNDIEAGKISYEIKSGKRLFDASEVARVYEDIDLSKLDEEENVVAQSKTSPNAQSQNTKLVLLEQENEFLREKIELREKEILSLKSKIIELEKSVEKETDYQKKISDRLYEAQKNTQIMLESKIKENTTKKRKWFGK